MLVVIGRVKAGKVAGRICEKSDVSRDPNRVEARIAEVVMKKRITKIPTRRREWNARMLGRRARIRPIVKSVWFEEAHDARQQGLEWRGAARLRNNLGSNRISGTEAKTTKIDHVNQPCIEIFTYPCPISIWAESFSGLDTLGQSAYLGLTDRGPFNITG